MPENVERNQTLSSEFLLLGLGDLKNFRILLFIFFLFIHVMGLTCTVLVVILLAFHPVLHSPMYLFFSQLSLCEIVFTTNVVPNILWLTLTGSGKMSISGCTFQFFILAFPTICQCLLLASMSFDRYVAICRPLHYATIMTFQRQLQIIIFCWLIALAVVLMVYVFLTRLYFCFLTAVNHFICTVPELIHLACSDTYVINLITSMGTFSVILLPLLFIITTYFFILRAILKIPSTTGKQKAFSTCSSHIIVVSLYYGTLCSEYLAPSRENSVNTNKGLSLVYIFLTPLFNPLIYSLRSQEMKTIILKHIKKTE